LNVIEAIRGELTRYLNGPVIGSASATATLKIEIYVRPGLFDYQILTLKMLQLLFPTLLSVQRAEAPTRCLCGDCVRERREERKRKEKGGGDEEDDDEMIVNSDVSRPCKKLISSFAILRQVIRNLKVVHTTRKLVEEDKTLLEKLFERNETDYSVGLVKIKDLSSSSSSSSVVFLEQLESILVELSDVFLKSKSGGKVDKFIVEEKKNEESGEVAGDNGKKDGKTDGKKKKDKKMENVNPVIIDDITRVAVAPTPQTYSHYWNLWIDDIIKFVINYIILKLFNMFFNQFYLDFRTLLLKDAASGLHSNILQKRKFMLMK
jgi:hypothetical protein